MPTAPQCKALLFDLDGTLLDTRALILASMRHTTLTILGREFSDAQLLSEVGIPLIDIMAHYDQSRAQEMVDTYRAYCKTVEDQLIASFANTGQVLEQLRSQGWPMAVVTSKRNGEALGGLARFGLLDYFEFLVGSNDTNRHKPHPEPLLLAAERLGAAPAQCVYLGDSPFDMQAARSANMTAIAALWGMFDRAALLAAGAQYELVSITQLPGLLQTF